MAKPEDRLLVRASQDVTLDGEIWGAEVHASDGSVKTYGIAGADGQAEAARKDAETAREAAETKRAEDEAARVDAESKRVTAEQERAAQQVKNNADQAANNAAAQGLIAVIVDNYDPETLKPNGEGQNGKMYLVPMPEANAMAEAIPVSFALAPMGDGEYTARRVDARSAAAGDVYVEWLWINNQYERIGLSTATLDPITTDHIDAVVSGESPQGKQVLTLTGLTYLWTKLKTAFAAIAHKHVTGDVTGLDAALGDKATKAELKTVQDSLNLKMPLSVITVEGEFISIDSAKAVVAYMRSNRVSMLAGAVNVQGIHPFIAHTYPDGRDYSVVLLFDCWNNIYMVTNYEGNWETRNL